MALSPNTFSLATAPEPQEDTGLKEALSPSPLAQAAGFQSDTHIQSPLSLSPSVAQLALPEEPPPLLQATQSKVPSVATGLSHEDVVKTPRQYPTVPKKDALSYLSRFNAGADLTNVEEAPLSAAYRMAQQAEREGYKMVITSGKRNRGGKSYHDHGEAIDARFFKVGKNGEQITLLPGEEAALGARLGKQAGFASMLDERQYNLGGSGPHYHFAWGNEHNLMNHPAHYMLNKRMPGDDGYLDTKAAGVPASDKGLPALAASIAKAQGVDPDIFKRLVTQESGWNPKAVSPVGAKGLTQFMPETLEWFAKKNGIDPKEFDSNPGVQLKLGAMYLKEQLNAFGGDYHRALAAYNWGPGNVQNMVKSGSNKMPAQTEAYVHNIMSGQGGKSSEGSGEGVSSTQTSIVAGDGPKATPAQEHEFLKNHLSDVQARAMDSLDLLFGREQNADPTSLKEVGKQTIRNLFDPNNDVNLKNTGHMMLKEVLQDATFGLSNPVAGWLGWGSFIEDAEKIQHARDALLETDGTGRSAMRAISVTGMALPRLLAASISGGWLVKGLKMIPAAAGGFEWLGAKASASAASGAAAAAEAAPGILRNTVLGRFAAPLIEQGVIGGLQMGSFAASDYLWDIQKKGEAYDPLELASHFGMGLAQGSLLGIGLGIILPASIGITGTALARMLGATPGREGAIQKTLEAMSKMGVVQRTLTATSLGGMAGGLTGATAHMLGVDQALTGENYSRTDALLGGASIGAGAALGGEMAGGALNKIGINWENAGRFFKAASSWIPGVNHFKEFFGRMGSEAMQLFNSQLMDLTQAWRHQAGALNAESIVKGHIELSNQSIAGRREAVKDLQTKSSEILKVDQSKQMEVQSLKAGVDHIEKVNPRFKEVADLDVERAKVLQEYVKAKQTNPRDDSLKPMVDSAEATYQAGVKGLSKDGLSDGYAKYADMKKRLAISSASLAEESAARMKASQVLLAEAQTHESIAAGMEVHNQLLADKLPHWIEIGGIDKWVQFPELDLNHLPKGAKREAIQAAFQSELGRTSYKVASERPGTWQNQQAVMAKRVHADLTRSYLGGKNPWEVLNAEHGRLSTTLEELRSKENVDAYSIAAGEDRTSFVRGKIKGSNLPIQHLDPAGMLAAESKVVYRHAVESGVDGALIDSAADALTSRIMAGEKSITPPSYDPTRPSVEAAAWAKVAMNFGEEYMPFPSSESKASVKAIRAIKEQQFAADRAKIDSELGVVKASADRLRQQRVDSVKTYNEKGKAVAWEDPSNPYAAGTNNYNAITASNKELLSKPSSRLQALAEDVKKNIPIVGENLHQPLDLMVEHGVDVSSKSAMLGFLTENPNSLKPSELGKTVRVLQDALAIAEIRRIDKMAELGDLKGKSTPNADRVVLNSLRMKYVNEIPDSVKPGAVDPLGFLYNQYDVTSFTQYDNQMASSVRTAIQDALKAMLPHEAVFGVSMRTWNELLNNRPKAFQALKDSVIKPHFDELMKPLKEAHAELDTPGGVDKFHRSLAEAIEDPNKMKGFRDRWGEKADPIVDSVYRLQTMIEKMKSADPHINTAAVSSYLLHKYQRAGAHIAALSDGKSARADSKAFFEMARKYDTLEKSEKAVKAAESELRTKGIDPDQFLNMDPETRAQKLFRAEDTNSGSSVTDWRTVNVKTKEKYLEMAQDKASTLMLKDPLVNPVDIMHNQLSAMVKASGMRTLTAGLSQIKVMVDPRTNLSRGIFTEIGTEGAAPIIFDAQGKQTGVYTRASELPGMAGTMLYVTTDSGGTVPISASKIAVHPGARKLFTDYLGNTQPKGAAGKATVAWQQITGLVRQNMLMGTFIPYMKDLIMSMVSDAINIPWKMMGMAAKGAGAMVADVHPEALKLQAIRSGVNMRTLERGMYEATDSMLNDFGPEFNKFVFGQGTLNNFLASIDASNPNRAQARARLSKMGGLVSDVFSGPQAVDHAFNQHGLFKMVEDHQVAGHYYRVLDLLKYDENIRSIEDPTMRLKAAQEVAADTTNRFAGAMPLSQISDPVRNMIFKVGLTPQWFMSKAFTIVDAIDAVSSLTSQAFKGGEKGIIERVFNREAFAQYPPETRNLVRARLAKVVGGMLVSSFAATQALQYMIDGTWTMNHPPDKWFHIHHDGAYYSSFFNQGFIKNIINLGNGSMKGFLSAEDAWENAGDIPQKFSTAIAEQLSSQATADLWSIGHQVHKALGEQKGVPLTEKALALFDAGIKGALPVGEVFGMNQNANLSEMVGARGDLSPTEKEARMMTASQYLLRQLGVWDSKEQTERNVRGEVAARMRDIRHEHMSKIQALLDRSKASDNIEDQMKYLQEARVAWAQGIPVKDKDLQMIHPGGIYRMSDKAFQGMVSNIYNPTAAALTGASGPTKLQVLMDMAEVKNGGIDL